MLWGTTVPLVADLGFPRKDKGLRRLAWRSGSHTGVNTEWVIHRSSFFFPSVDSAVDNSGQGLLSPLGNEVRQQRGPRYFHCVETPNPAAMKPKPTTMFQLPSGSIGSLPSVT